MDDQPKTTHQDQPPAQVETEGQAEQQAKPNSDRGFFIAYLCMNSMDSVMKSLTCVC